MVTTGKGNDGLVLGGRPVSDEHLGGLLGIHEKTIGKHRRRLKTQGYIDWKRTPIGYAITVKKSKKWVWIQNRTRSQTAPSRSRNATSREPNGSALETDRLPPGAETLHPDQTKQDRSRTKDAAATSECWKAIGEKLPLGTKPFQEIWEFLFSHKNGEPLSEAMERAILRAQSNGATVPRPFYEAKRRIETQEATRRNQRLTPSTYLARRRSRDGDRPNPSRSFTLRALRPSAAFAGKCPGDPVAVRVAPRF